MSLESELENARPGDRILVRGRQVGGKIQNVRGTAQAWIELVGEDDTATLIPEPGYPYAVIRFEDCQYLRVGGLRVEGDGNTERAVQVFRSDYIHLHDLHTSGVTQDHIHTPGCNHVLIQRLYSDGAGGENMGGGKGGHAVYFTRVDGGGDCEDLVAEDCDCVGIWGAAYQANGDGRELYEVRFTRCRAEEYGRLGGSGVNLAYCRNPVLEDIILVPHALNDNPGIASFDGTTGTVMRRFDIDCDDLWSGPMEATAGEPEFPAPPGYEQEPSPGPEPPEPEPGPEPEPEEITVPCVTCSGVGQVLAAIQPPEATEPALINCPTCLGRGTVTVES